MENAENEDDERRENNGSNIGDRRSIVLGLGRRRVRVGTMTSREWDEFESGNALWAAGFA
jgi:hypothetical protein